MVIAFSILSLSQKPSTNESVCFYVSAGDREVQEDDSATHGSPNCSVQNGQTEAFTSTTKSSSVTSSSSSPTPSSSSQPPLPTTSRPSNSAPNTCPQPHPPPKPDPSPNQADPVRSEPEKLVAKSRQPGNNPVLPHKSELGKKQNVSRQTGTNPVSKKSEPSKNELSSLHTRPNKVGPKLERTEAKPHSNRVSTGSKALEDNKSSKTKLVKERPELSRRLVRVGSGYLEREEKKRGERGWNNGRGNKGRPPSKSPMGRGKRGRREGGEPPPVVDSGRPRKRSKR